MIIKEFKLFEAQKPWAHQELIALWDAYMGLVDGIDGIISEEGELSDSYWKENVEKELDEITAYVKNAKHIEEKKDDIIKNLGDLLDGLDGALGSGKTSESRYFKKGAISTAKKMLSKYKK